MRQDSGYVLGQAAVERKTNEIAVAPHVPANRDLTGAGPQALAAIHNAILSSLRFHGESNMAAATRSYTNQPQHALQRTGAPALWNRPAHQ